LEEKQNLKLKQYLDLNRFSAVIKCNLSGDWKTALEIYGAIDLKNLSKKKRILLQLPPIVLKLLLKLQLQLTNLGIGNSVFR
jgi:hypothetical protein